MRSIRTENRFLRVDSEKSIISYNFYLSELWTLTEIPCVSSQDKSQRVPGIYFISKTDHHKGGRCAATTAPVAVIAVAVSGPTAVIGPIVVNGPII